MFLFQIIVGARLQKLAYVHRSHAVPVILQFSNGVGSNYSNLIINDKALKSANTIFIHDYFVKWIIERLRDSCDKVPSLCNVTIKTKTKMSSESCQVFED